MHSSTPARRFSFLKRAFFSAAALVLALAALEAAVRILLPPVDWDAAAKRLQSGAYSRWDGGHILTYVYNQDYNFRLAPGILDGPVPVMINSLGIKGPLPPPIKTPGTVRIVVLGGSSVFQFSRQTGQNWPDLLAMKLTQRTGYPIEIINAATPGYTSYQSSMRLQTELIKQNPDLVIVCHLWNDIKYFASTDPRDLVRQWEALAPKKGGFSALSQNPVLDGLSRVSQATAHIRVRIVTRRLDRAVSLQEGRVHRSSHETIKPQGPEFYQENLERIITVLHETNTPGIILKTPTLVRPDNTTAEREKIKYHYTGFDHPTLVEAYRRGWQINDRLCKDPAVYCLQANTAVPSTLDFFQDQVHLTNQGREALAEYVDHALAETFPDMKILLEGHSHEQNH